MKAFRIGKIRQPWINFEPPLRGGVYRKYGEEEMDDESDCFTSNSDKSICSVDYNELENNPANNLSRVAYTAAQEQQEIADGMLAYPSVNNETQRAITAEYQALHRQIKEEGFYQCHYVEYGKDALRWLLLFSAFLFLLNAKCYLWSALFLGMFWHQIMFTAHDAGHRAITGNFVADTLIGIFIADFCCGLSIGWWKSSHNVHHLITNKPVRCTPP
jgi:sphingolipid 8-(E)-desaturase